MPTLVSMLMSVPNVIWSGVLGAVLALSGVLLSNRSNTIRLRLQLQHDATEKAKERTAVLRREVYLRVIEELANANSHLASLPNLDPTKVNLSEGFQGFFSFAARLQLIAEPDTALLVNKLVGEYGELLVDLLAQLQPAHIAKSDIQIADHHYMAAQTEVSRVLGEMAKINESGVPNPAAFQGLQASFDFQQRQSATLAADRDAAWVRFNEASIAFQRVVFGKLRELAPKQIPVMIALRRDLGLSGDLDGLEMQLHQQMQRMEERLNSLFATLRDRYYLDAIK